jgi:hypothetical protein
MRQRANRRARPVEEPAPYDLLTKAAHLVRRICDGGPKQRKGSMPKCGRARKQHIKMERWSIDQEMAEPRATNVVGRDGYLRPGRLLRTCFPRLTLHSPRWLSYDYVILRQ